MQNKHINETSAQYITVLDHMDDLLQMTEIIKQFEELEAERETLSDILEDAKNHQYRHRAAELELDNWDASESGVNFKLLTALTDELNGNGGDEEFRGDWFPSHLIRYSYFENYMDEMLEDIGDIPKDLPCYLSITVDYRALAMDYSTVEINGIEYMYR